MVEAIPETAGSMITNEARLRPAERLQEHLTLAVLTRFSWNASTIQQSRTGSVSLEMVGPGCRATQLGGAAAPPYPGSCKGPCKNNFQFCWRQFGLLARRERRAYPQRYVRSEQRSQEAKGAQPTGAVQKKQLENVICSQPVRELKDSRQARPQTV
jgi:hypothetical protein